QREPRTRRVHTAEPAVRRALGRCPVDGRAPAPRARHASAARHGVGAVTVVAPAPARPMTSLRATYRLQLSPDLDLPRARELVPYLGDLGVSHVYLSPVLQARKGSTHGYDVVDPTQVSTDLGGEPALEALAATGIGVILDVVPNHMAVDELNPFW